MRTSRISPNGSWDVRGTVRRRLLINAVVDPDEASRRLPAGLRPHVTETGGTVVGCCLVEFDHIRPAAFPAATGIRLRAAASRISVEWDDSSGERVAGVYVPVRHTDSRLAVALGGRWFPGVHRPARITIAGGPDGASGLTWRVDGAGSLGVRVAVTASAGRPSASSEPIGVTCLAADLCRSPNHRGVLEAARMAPTHRRARQVAVDDLHSGFLSGFSTATPAPSYLVEDVEVHWSRVAAPRLDAAPVLVSP
jgi:hypothetical protein